MFTSGSFVAEQLNSVTDAQRQPNGVDLTVDSILEQETTGTVTTAGKTIGDRSPVEPNGGTYTLDPGGYIAQYAETVRIPTGHIGFVYPRSTLMRNSCMLHTAVWDAGYEGKGEGLLEVHHPIEIEPGARIAQLVLATADHDGAYDGSYQGERTDRQA
ncbi:MAG: deoxyuridine 5'-triphosphate nucleotidohydrolase [Halobacteriota archaeon]